MDDLIEEILKYNPDLASYIPQRDNDSFYIEEPEDDCDETR